MHCVTEQMLFCIKNNEIYPQDVQVSKRMWLSFDRDEVTLSKVLLRTVKVKHVEDWPHKTADQINKILSDKDWKITNG